VVPVDSGRGSPWALDCPFPEGLSDSLSLSWMGGTRMIGQEGRRAI